MSKYLKELESLMFEKNSILEIVEQVSNLRQTINNAEELTLFVNKVREIVQWEAAQSIISNGGRGMVILPTGSGKSKVAIDLAMYYKIPQYFHSILVPTEKLRDENWKEEYIKWNMEDTYWGTETYCYASASKIKSKDFTFVILDEAHNITELSSEFFYNNKVENVIALTATKPTDQTKLKIFQDLNIPIVYELSLDDAVKLGFVAPYKIKVVTVSLNNSDKDVVGGTKKSPFMTTEDAMYSYLNRAVSSSMFDKTPSGKAKFKFATMRRMHFIYKLKSKQRAMKFILDNLIPEDDRVLIFAGGIEQAEDICPDFFHSKSGSESYDLFRAEKINRLSCVKAVNEGHNFPSIDKGLIGQVDSNDKNLTQRIGRLIRFRPGHEALLYIIVAENTQDEKWLEKALENVDKTKVEYLRFINLLNKHNGNT